MYKKPVLGFANQKGGVGKTSWSKTMCEYLTLIKGEKTLGIDIDSQSSLSARFLEIYKNPVTDQREPPIHPYFKPNNKEDWDGRSSIADIFFGKIPKPYPTTIQHLEIIPSDEGALLKIDEVKRQEMAEKIYSQLHNFISLKDVQNHYDVFVIDTPPAKGPLTISAFKAMTHLVIPLEIEIQAIEGLTGLLQLWKQETVSRPKDFPLKLVGVLPNKVHNRRSIDRDLLEDLRSNYESYIIPLQMADRVEIPKCDLDRESIFQYPDTNPAKQEVIPICEYIYKGLFK